MHARSTQPLDLRDAPPRHESGSCSRADLGIPEDCFAIVLAAEPASAGDARRFAYFVALLEALHRPVVGVLPEASWNLDRAARWTRAAGPRWSFRVLHAPLDECWNAFDLGAIIAAPWVLDHDRAMLIEGLTRMVHRAHRAGTPIIWSGPGQPALAYPASHAESLRSASDESHRVAYKAVALLDDEAQLNQTKQAVRDHVTAVRATDHA